MKGVIETRRHAVCMATMAVLTIVLVGIAIWIGKIYWQGKWRDEYIREHGGVVERRDSWHASEGNPRIVDEVIIKLSNGADVRRILAAASHYRAHSCAIIVDNTHLDAHAVECMANIRNLEWVRARNCSLTDSDLRLLRRSNLISLEVANNPLTGDAFRDWEKVDSLTTLELSGTALRDDSLAPLLQFHNLERLDVSSTAISNDGCKLLANMSALGKLNIAKTSVGDAGLQNLALADSLYEINVRGSRVTREGAARFRRLRPSVLLIVD